jgi:hypothetical protein
VPRIGDIVGDFEGLIVGLVDVGGAEGDLNGLSVGCNIIMDTRYKQHVSTNDKYKCVD